MEFTVGLQKIDRGQVSLVGGKAVNLGELTKVDGIIVPTGFCVTTHAFVTSWRTRPTLPLPWTGSMPCPLETAPQLPNWPQASGG